MLLTGDVLGSGSRGVSEVELSWGASGDVTRACFLGGGARVSSLMARARLDASGVGVGQIIRLGSMQISIRPDVHAEHFLL